MTIFSTGSASAFCSGSRQISRSFLDFQSLAFQFFVSRSVAVILCYIFDFQVSVHDFFPFIFTRDGHIEQCYSKLAGACFQTLWLKALGQNRNDSVINVRSQGLWGSQMPDKKDGIETLQHCERVYKILYKNQKIFLTHLLEDTNNNKANANTTNTLFNMSTLDFPV